MRRTQMLLVVAMAIGLAAGARAGENLRINPRLDYSSDSQDGPLITGDHMDEGAVAGRPNYVFIYGEG